MALPDKPEFFFNELEVLKPRPGIRMAVRFHDTQGEPLTKHSDLSIQPAVLARLSLEQAYDVYERKFAPNPNITGVEQAALTFYTFILSGGHGRVDPRYERDMNLFIGETIARIPPAHQSIHLDAPLVPDEALFPDQLANPYMHQFLLTRERNTNGK